MYIICLYNPVLLDTSSFISNTSREVKGKGRSNYKAISANNTLYSYIPNLVYAEIFGILHSLVFSVLD